MSIIKLFDLNVQDESEDVFKIGRSTGRVFKEKGVSVYKDKEISTTHSKVGNITTCISLASYLVQ